ncbi:hypothetical protein COD70_26275 [Bacillus cereus]|nr:hypothetical protein COD70_26275 [Bacillus cereus]
MEAKEIIQVDEFTFEADIIEDGYQEDSIENAKEVLRRLEQSKSTLIKGDFQDDIWTFIINEMEFRVSITFANIKNKQIKNSIKCWAANLLINRNPRTVYGHVDRLIRFMKETDMFNLSKVEELDEVIMKFSLYERSKAVTTPINYLEYINQNLVEITYGEEYLNTLETLRNKYPHKKTVRDLPPYKDILRFAFILEKFMDKCSGKERLKYMPLLLWWKITAVIPLRSSEFCSIKRECIFPKDGGYYISLPRRKQPATINTFAVDADLPISREIYELISEYIQMTSFFGETKTLISRAAYEATNRRKVIARTTVSNRFNSKAFLILLREFYNEIISKQLNLIVVEKSDLQNTPVIKDSSELGTLSNQIVMIKPNDTRHLAMCSMMLQGFDQLTIARIAGHKHIKSQYSYQTHLEYFAESKAYELTLLNLSSNLAETTSYYSTLAVQDEINKSLKNINNAEYLEEVEIGYCTDKQMRCESSECILCSKNWIPREMIEERFQEIIEKNIQSKKG